MAQAQRRACHTHFKDGEAEGEGGLSDLHKGAVWASAVAAPTFPDLPASCSQSTKIPCF